MSSGESPKSRLRLTDLAAQYFKKEGFKVKNDELALDGFSGISRRFDLIVQKGRVEQGV
jgi:hypothetical protein